MVLRTLLYITPRNISDLTVVNETTEETMIISESPDYDECDLFYLADSDIITISAPGYRTITNTAEYFSDNPYVNLEQIREVANLSDGVNTYQIKAKTVENTNGGSVKIWTGTQAQYNAIATKDSNTLYNITDDVSVTQTILETLYPVGSLYIGKMSTCPLASLIPNSTWTLVENRFLLSSGTKNVGATGGSDTNVLTEANMPGRVVKMVCNTTGSSVSGYSMLACQELGNKNVTNTNWAHVDSIDGGNYGMDDTNVAYGQAVNNLPPYIVVNIWERTA